MFKHMQIVFGNQPNIIMTFQRFSPSLGFHCTSLLLQFRLICLWGRSRRLCTTSNWSGLSLNILNTAVINEEHHNPIIDVTNIKIVCKIFYGMYYTFITTDRFYQATNKFYIFIIHTGPTPTFQLTLWGPLPGLHTEGDPGIFPSQPQFPPPIS